jgi:hypothetical protein
VTAVRKKPRALLPDLRKFARGQVCQIRIPGACNHNTETVCLCHSRQGGIAGMGQKACDLNGAHGCSGCHAVVDGRAPRPEGFTKADVDLMFAHGVFRTNEKVWRYLHA